MGVYQCYATQQSDQMVCRCGLAWDVNDPDPPTCRNDLRSAKLAREPEDRAVVTQALNAPMLVRRLAKRPLNRVEMAFNCAVARSAYDEGLKEAFRAIRHLLK